MGRLEQDGSPRAQVEAALTYNVVVEGVLAETGYQGFFQAAERLRARGLDLPGTLAGVAHIKQDESRHIAYGLFLIARHLGEDPGLWSVVEARLNLLLPEALGVVQELFAAYPEGMPLEIALEEFLAYAMGQFSSRMRVLERARSLGPGALEGLVG
jgi:ribonucleoside-diphosphate reductase beta chain